MKQKRIKTIAASLILVMSICSACGQENKMTVSENASGPAVQDEPSAPAKTALTPGYYPRYYNDRCLYVSDWETGVYQYSLDGKNETHIDLDDNIGGIWVTDEWLYYIGSSDDSAEESGTIWRVPLKKQGEKTAPDEPGKETVSTKNKEKMADVELGKWGDFLNVTDTYVAYTYKKSICRLDLKNKKVKNITEGIKFAAANSHFPHMMTDATLNPYVKNDLSFFYDKQGKLYRLDLKKGVCKQADPLLQKNGVASRICSDEEHLYFGTSEISEGGITRYDIESNTAENIVPGTDIENLLKEADPWNYKENSADWIAYTSFVYNGRLYMSIELMWENEEDEPDEEGAIPGPHYADLVISCQAEDGSGLTYEKELSECMYREGEQFLHGDFDHGNWFDETGYVRGLIGNYAIVTTTANEESDKFAWVFYDLETGRHHTVKSGDDERYLLYYFGDTDY